MQIEQIISRIKKLKGLSNDKEVADILEISPNSLTNHKVRGTVPYKKLITFCVVSGISTDWLLQGKGEMYSDKPNNVIEKIILLLKDMDSEQQRDVLKYVKKEKLLRKLLDKYNEKVA